MAVFADLEILVGPSIYPPRSVDWIGLEGALGFTFPVDYKRLFDSYNHIQFDGFLDITHPVNNVNRMRELGIATVGDLCGYTDIDGMVRMVDNQGSHRLVPPYPIYPDAGGLFPWGATENGDRLMWLTSSGNPEKWPTVVTDDGYEWWQYDGSFVDLLVGMMDGTVCCPILPENWPSSRRVHQFGIDEF